MARGRGGKRTRSATRDEEEEYYDVGDPHLQETKTLIRRMTLAEFNLFRRNSEVNQNNIEQIYIDYNNAVAETINDNGDERHLQMLLEHKNAVDRMFSYIKNLEAIKHHMDEFDAGKLSTHGFEDLKNMIKQIRNIQQEFPSVTNRHQPIIGKYNHIETVINQINAERSTRRPQSPPRVSTPIIELLSNSGNNTDQPNQFPPLWTNHIRWNPRPGAVRIQPKQIHKFSGDPIDYHKFREDIEHYIINNPEIDGAKNKLKEIQDLLPLNHRYLLNRIDRSNPKMEDIIQTLDRHYGGRHQIIPALTRKIQGAPFLSTRPQLKDYEGLLEVVISVVDTLKLTNLTSEDFHLATYVMYKIDEIHHQHIGNEYELNLNDIEEYLRRGLTRKQALTARMDTNPYIMRDRQRNATTRRPNNIMINTNASTCLFRDGEHQTEDCKLTSDERRQFLISNRLCFKCGLEGHNSRECTTTVRCRGCNRNHATYLCYQRSNQQRRTESVNATSPSPSTSTTSHTQSTSQPSLLTQNGRSIHKTLTTVINGRAVRVVFDEGASSSFISTELANEWKLNRYRAEPICMDTLSINKPTMTGHVMVKIEMQTWDGNRKKLEFRLNDKINKLHFECIPHEQQQRIKQLNIDYHDEQRPVEMLIGLDNINQLQLTEERRLNKDVIAKRTTIGWVVFGAANTSNILLNVGQTSTIESALDVDMDIEDKIAMEKFLDDYCNSDCVKYDPAIKRYEVKLPFIPNVKVDTNFEAAKRQIIGMVKKMTDERRKQYQTLIDDMERDDIIGKTEVNPHEGYHMPHFVITRNDKNTTKMRMVFNASNGSKPLNKAIFKGVTSWHIIRSLLFFRLQSIAVISDIKAAFHNIVIQEVHRQFVKFLWVEPTDQLVCYRFNRLPFGLSSSPFILYAVIVHHLKKYQNRYPQTVYAIKNGLYVDDLIMSARNPLEVQLFKDQSQEIFADASMELRKWRSSEPTLNKKWNDGLAENKVLGIEWSEDDRMKVMIPEFDETDKITKRLLLSYHASIYDPFGFVLASTLKLKILIHKVWTGGFDWDDELDTNLLKEAKLVIKDIKKLNSFSFQRKIFDQQTDEFDLWIFVDANKNAIGAACYLTNGSTGSLIYAKSKLIKPRKIVSSELLALTMGANISQTLADLLKPKEIVLFSDSLDNVKRLDEDINRYPYPVAVHLFNIKSKVATIQHVNGKKNPADAFTRGVTIDELEKLHRLNIQDIVNDPPSLMMLQTNHNDKKPKHDYDVSKFDLEAKRTYEQWIELVQQQSAEWKKSIIDNEDELTILIKLNQQQFIDESFKTKYTLFFDDQGIARCLTRLEHAEMDYDEKYPIVLPRCEFTKSFLENVHQRDEHGSVAYSLANVRMKYFVPRARQMLIKIKNRCQKCRQMTTKPLKVFWGNPPGERVNRSYPFENIGVDLFELRTQPKTTGMIFTCCVTRAVHFEVLEKLSAEGLCDAFMIFASLHRTPSVVYSDNGTNLKRLGNMLNEAFMVLKQKFQWRFITPAAPFRGGFYEALIKSMKRGFYSIVWRKEVKSNDVRIILYRIQALMNARPLVNNESHILTPNHLVYGHNTRETMVPPRKGVTPGNLVRYWRGTQRLVNAAWKTYKDVYLKGLRTYHQNNRHYEQVRVGDHVLVVDERLPVSLWKVGRVVDRIADKRGVVRTYKVEVDGRELERPAQKIAPLESSFEDGGGNGANANASCHL
ncbi:hypothetical protein DERF_001715 [Dermatophagoides farinae]|uniref:Uncharacterized protein n=1 Tax=Dermatophagoides farinae TaxID=6954 RepID=A0A922ICC0_DERFA|nr:hypothetical protein DERF_001715 [Dermatophagoides farinae]